ncbi:MAG: efflux RND transporter periplasmic adaptor subunit [Bacteroidetes bacterium]|nr:efflux RND transporter periplasmic adaptor subunit [Bacteroidota bacterium]
MKKLYFTIIASVVMILVIVLLFFLGHKKENSGRQEVLSDVPVTIDTVIKKSLTNLVSMVGLIDPENDVEIISEAKGMITRLNFKIGDQVKKGTVLVEVDDVVIKSDMARQEINYFKAKRDFDRNKTLYEQNSISASQLDISRLDMQAAENDLTRAKKALDDTRVKAPINGTINTKKVNEGSYIQQNSSIGNIVDISTMKVKVSISEKDAFVLHPGDSVEITTDVYPGQRFLGHVDNIASKADEAHTYPVEIHLPNNPAFPLKGGMFGRINFTSITSRDAIAISRDALIGSVKNAQVFVIKGNIASLRNITIGRESGQLLEVLNGLEEGEMVVTSGQNNLSDNLKVIIVK